MRDTLLGRRQSTGVGVTYGTRTGPRAKNLRLKIVVAIVVGGLLAGVAPELRIAGFALKGYAWVLALGTAGIQAFRHLKRVTFPIGLWLPWAGFLLAYLFLSYHENAVQRTAMLVCPILVGAAVSTAEIGEEHLRQVLGMLRWVAVFLVLVSLLHLGVLVTGRLPETSGLASEVMTGALLACIFTAMVANGVPQAIALWVAMVAIPVLGVTRTGIVATAMTFPTSLARVGVFRRAAAVGLFAVAGLALFYTPRIQHKMFSSGSGSLQDLRLENPDLATSGRLWMWGQMNVEIDRNPWFGHGANAQEEFLFELFGENTQPHNDWLRLEFDYGYVGTVLFGATFLAQALLAWWLGRASPGSERVLFLGSASAFVPFVLFMFTDNIILYAVFFGNLQFLFLGLAYAGRATRLRKAQGAGHPEALRVAHSRLEATGHWGGSGVAWRGRRA